jgi:hypothetical protein
VYGGKLRPQVHRDVIHVKIFFNFFTPNLRVGSIKFREHGFG